MNREELKIKCGITISDNLNAKISWNTVHENCYEVISVRFNWEKETALSVESPFLEISFSMPQKDIAHMWHPLSGFNRGLREDWCPFFDTMESISAPVVSLFNESGKNRCTIAVSELRQRVQWNIGIHEEDASMLCRVRVPVELFRERECYAIKLYRDFSDTQLENALDQVRLWWESACDIHPLPVPESAFLPMYSTWYSHHQDVNEKNVEEDCRHAVELGLKAVILDDGWQTDDGNRGYAYCGDWEPSVNKFPDMAAHVRRIHAMGMKYLVWFSVPFVGIHASCWSRFSDKLLHYNPSHQAGVLDPRYPEVRQYLIDTYTRVVRDWDLDGLKLDFIDDFYARPDSPVYNAGMDYSDVQDAVNCLMTDIHTALKKICPDIMIEFRQRYIGPSMREYGNMFRVGDCPGDLLRNRVGVADLRMLSGNTAVHADPIVWHKDESCENAELTLLNVLFGVVQFSVCPQILDERKKEMVKFWISYMKQNRELLLTSHLHVSQPHMLYPSLYVEDDTRSIMAVYQPQQVIYLDTQKETLDLINATQEKNIILAVPHDVDYHVCCFDCCGNLDWEDELKLSGIAGYPIPSGGLLRLERKK